ncbi:MAG: T9SS type A sorting domain-containing protein [Syntrophothermus sp.]
MKQYILLILFVASVFISHAQQALIPQVAKPVYFDVSPPLRDMLKQKRVEDKSWKQGFVKNYITDPELNYAFQTDPVLQQLYGLLPGDSTIVNVEGIPAGNSVPPDTYGEIGPNHYFQVVNTSYAIYNKAGQLILGPLGNSTIWNGMPHNENSGDAVVLYDETADRWLFTQFSLPAEGDYQMIAISQTPDPTGPWYRYQYQFNFMPDYPKFGVWQDGYYMSSNNFGWGWMGNGAYAFDRNAMLSGQPDAVRISFEMSPGSDGFVTLYPSDCDGTLPPAGTPNYFGFIKTSSPQSFGIYEFHADFVNPEASTFGNKLVLPVTAFSSYIDGIPQLGTSAKLETLSDRLMYRLQYRKFSDHEAMVVNHSVNTGSGNSGIRWYEFRKTTGPWNIYQESTYAPDNNYRWMGSIAMDTAGSIGLGYSVSSSSMYPSIRYTGRHKNDPLNQMTIAEGSIIEGTGSQTGVWSGRSRWGDYSGMSIDPAAPTTFWFTTEYYPVTTSMGWHTRIASFTFDNVFSGFASAYPGVTCGADTTQLDAVVYGGTGSYTYQWTSEPAGFSSTQKNPLVYTQVNTKYCLAITNGSQVIHDTVKVSISHAPVIHSGNDTTVCEWLHVLDLHGTINECEYFNWFSPGDGTFGNIHDLNTTYTFGPKDLEKDTVDFYLFARAKSPCTGMYHTSHRVTLTPCTGISANKKTEPGILITPNPASDHVLIHVEGNVPDAVLTLHSMDGRLMETIPFNGQPVRLDLAKYARGIYMVRVTGQKVSLSRQLVVE